MKSLFSFLALVAMISIAQGQTTHQDNKKFSKKAFVISSSVYWAGATSDILSSRNKYESNPILRTNDNKLSTGKAWMFAAIPYSISLFVDKKGHHKVANIIRYIGGSVHFGAAIHNWHLGN